MHMILTKGQKMEFDGQLAVCVVADEEFAVCAPIVDRGEGVTSQDFENLFAISNDPQFRDIVPGLVIIEDAA
jgi:hypothetical protein